MFVSGARMRHESRDFWRHLFKSGNAGRSNLCVGHVMKRIYSLKGDICGWGVGREGGGVA